MVTMCGQPLDRFRMLFHIDVLLCPILLDDLGQTARQDVQLLRRLLRLP